MIKRSIQQEDITVVNIHAHNLGASKYIKQLLTDLKGEINSNTIIGEFNALIVLLDRSSRQKISKETSTLKDT